jgi:hypothetical protein
MATVKIVLKPEEAQFLATAFPALQKVNGTNFPVFGLYYDATSDEAAFWAIPTPNYGSGNITITIYWYAATASSGNVSWEAQISAITPNDDTTNIEVRSLATLNHVQDTHLGTTPKRLHSCSITLTNTNSIAADDLVYIRIARDADSTNNTDDMTGDAVLLAVLVSYSDT